MIRILISKENTLLKNSLAMLIGGSSGFGVAGAFEDCTSILEDLTTHHPDVVLLDIDMPVINGIEALKKVRQANSDVKVLMLTVFDDDQNVFEAIKNGANGYLLK